MRFFCVIKKFSKFLFWYQFPILIKFNSVIWWINCYSDIGSIICFYIFLIKVVSFSSFSPSSIPGTSWPTAARRRPFVISLFIAFDSFFLSLSRAMTQDLCISFYYRVDCVSLSSCECESVSLPRRQDDLVRLLHEIIIIKKGRQTSGIVCYIVSYRGKET